VARIDLHAIKTAAVNGHHRALNINEVILAQICCPFIRTSIAGTRRWALGARRSAFAETAGFSGFLPFQCPVPSARRLVYSRLTASSTCPASA
jgi:hypothetical protein